MEIIKTMIAKIDDEFADAQGYFAGALEAHEQYLAAAKAMYENGIEELTHAERLYSVAVALITEQRKRQEPPAVMTKLWQSARTRYMERMGALKHMAYTLKKQMV